MAMQLYTLPLVGMVEEAQNVRTFLFPIPEDFTWNPGAHIHVGLPGFNANGERHPQLVRHLSICTLPEEGKLGFTTRLDSSESQFKTTLRTLRPNDELTFFKCGSVLDFKRDERPVVLVSQGVGIASMRPLILAYVRDRVGIPSLTSLTVDSAEHGIYEREFEDLHAPNLELRRLAHRDELFDALADRSNQGDSAGAKPVFEVVGSDAFLRTVIAKLRELGVADADIILDKNDAKRAPFFETQE